MNIPAGGKIPVPVSGYFWKIPELLAIGEEALHQYDEAGKIEYAKKLVRQTADEVALVLLYEISILFIIQPYVNTPYLKEMSVCRYCENE